MKKLISRICIFVWNYSIAILILYLWGGGVVNVLLSDEPSKILTILGLTLVLAVLFVMIRGIGDFFGVEWHALSYEASYNENLEKVKDTLSSTLFGVLAYAVLATIFLGAVFGAGYIFWFLFGD